MAGYPNVLGVHLLPSTGEFTYDTVAHQGETLLDPVMQGINTFLAGSPPKTDYSFAIDQLQAAHPECATVSVVCAWFFDSLNAASCHIFPSTNFIGGAFQQWNGSAWVPDAWKVSSLTQASSGLIAIPTLPGGGNVYGGTPSDQSIVRCIKDLKARGFRVVFYPFLLSTAAGFPWRGQITFTPDLSSAAASAVASFMGSAAVSQFTPDATNLTVAYSGSPTDYTYRRMILHYANLVTLAGGVDLFVIGSELKGFETIRGPGWTKAGTLDGSGNAIWDYPAVAALQTLSDDVRSVLNNAGLTKNTTTLKNLVTYSADWSVWMGFQHPGENGQWPHLDQLWAHSNIDIVAFDNYLPLSDWTTGGGGLDVLNWSAPAYAGAWPPPSTALNGLGLSGVPSIYSMPYLKGNIEGGEHFDWFYNDSNNLGRGFDPNGTDLQVSLPEGDRLTQSRNALFANQQILANKQYRWWWNNQHFAVYDTGSGFVPQGAHTQWVPNSKSIAFLEYGFAAVDKGTNQPNVFFDPKSVQSDTPYWSIWDPAQGLQPYLPRRDDTMQISALKAIYEYWNVDGFNSTVGGVVMVQFAFSCVWNWDARPFPVFPILNSQWGDAANWEFGDWIGGRWPPLPPLAPTPPPTPPSFPTFPSIATISWSVIVKPRFASLAAEHASGRSSRGLVRAFALRDVELTYDVLRSDAAHLELQTIAGFFERMSGGNTPFWFAPPGLDGNRPGNRDRRRPDDSLSAGAINGRLQRAGGWRVRRDGSLSQRRTASERLERFGRICAGHHVHNSSGRVCGDHRRFWRAVAVPLRRGRSGLRGIHGAAFHFEDAAPGDGAAVTPPLSFPMLTGQGWSVHKKPIFSTIVAQHVSGREVRDALYQNPIWQFELTFDGLDGSASGSYPGLGLQSLQSLMGLFLQCQGQFGTFLYTDPSDSAVNAGAIATGDGTTTTFTFSRFLGGFFEPVGFVTSVSNVLLNGVNQPSGWSLVAPNSLVFVTAPGSGVAITATFAYAFECRFSADDQDFEQFMQNLWKAESVTFRSVRSS
jgi:hypothetical protein